MVQTIWRNLRHRGLTIHKIIGAARSGGNNTLWVTFWAFHQLRLNAVWPSAHAQELEDGVCDMTLAVAGSRAGITAAQLTANIAGTHSPVPDELRCEDQKESMPMIDLRHQPPMLMIDHNLEIVPDAWHSANSVMKS